MSPSHIFYLIGKKNFPYFFLISTDTYVNEVWVRFIFFNEKLQTCFVVSVVRKIRKVEDTSWWKQGLFRHFISFHSVLLKKIFIDLQFFNQSKAMLAILDVEPCHWTKFWKRMTQGASHRSLIFWFNLTQRSNVNS